jgi:NAD-dependent SIR2 family protein deacetylase
MTDRVEQLATWLREASMTVVLTGAGVSTESGIPDFRGPNGIWTRDPRAERLSNIGYYIADPSIRREAWQRRPRAGGARPPPRHAEHRRPAPGRRIVGRANDRDPRLDPRLRLPDLR